MRSRRSATTQKPKLRINFSWQKLFDVLMLGAWSAVLIRYWLNQSLLLLVPPVYSQFVKGTALLLALLAMYQLWKILSRLVTRQSAEALSQQLRSMPEGAVSMLPPWLSRLLLLALAVFGLIYSPQPLSPMSASAVSGSGSTPGLLSIAHPRPPRAGPTFLRSLRVVFDPDVSLLPRRTEPDSIDDWVREIERLPEPNAYNGRAVAVEGFVLYPPGWPEEYLMVSRSLMPASVGLTYPIGLPVRLPERAAYPVGSWLRVTGEMNGDILAGRRQVIIVPDEVRSIEAPEIPYEY